MAKKQNLPTAHGEEDSTPTLEVVEEPTSNPVEEDKVKVKKEVRIVTMDDGTQANFGARANLLSAIDLESSTVTFRIVTGKIINWTIQNMDNLTEFQKMVFMYGLLEKIKTSLAPIKLPKMVEAIQKQIVAIERGEFNVRSLSSAGEVVLTDLQKAYALAFSEQYPAKKHWANVDDAATIAEVLGVWEGKSPAQRNAIRRHPSVGYQLNVMAMNAGEAEALDSM